MLRTRDDSAREGIGQWKPGELTGGSPVTSETSLTVMQVVLSLQPGGLERMVVDLVNHSAENIRFVVCCLEELGSFSGLLDPLRGRAIALGKHPGLDWRMVWRIAQLARAEKVRVVHTHNAGAHLYGSLGGKLGGARVLHTEHSGKEFQSDSSGRVNRFAARFTDITVAVSNGIASHIVKREGVSPSKLLVVPNGIPIDPDSIREDVSVVRSRLGLPVDGKIIGTVGRLAAVKNYPMLLNACRDLILARRDLFLVLVGDGPLRNSLEEEARRLQIADKVLFLGHRSDVRELVASFDVFALSSHAEGLSIALLEAMAAGRPIVATAVGGNPELIQDGATGLMVQAGDQIALGRAIESLLKDPSRAHAMGLAARRVALERYTVQQMARRYEEIYRWIADGRKGTPAAASA